MNIKTGNEKGTKPVNDFYNDTILGRATIKGVKIGDPNGDTDVINDNEKRNSGGAKIKNAIFKK